MTGTGECGASELVASRYRLMRVLQAGDRTILFAARDEVLARDVAVELLRRDLVGDAESCDRFRDEVLRAGRASHPNLIAVFDTGDSDGRPFAVTELPAGRSVREALAADGPFSQQVALTVAYRVADAVAHLHAVELVHGALDAGNVLVEQPSHHGPVVKVAGAGVPVAGRASFAADIKAVGELLHEMLTGRPAAPHPAPPSDARPEIAHAVDSVVLAACRGNFETMGELRAHLVELMVPDDATPLVARDDTPPTGTPRTPSFAHTERRWLVPAVLILLAGATLAIVGVTFARSGLGDVLLSSPTTGRPIPIAAVVPFDPQGDGQENNESASAVVDGDPQTAWHSDRYRTPEFGNLKEGLGLIVETASAGSERRLVIETATPGWSALIYTAAQVGAAPADWGTPVAEITGANPTTTAQVPATDGRFLLVWFTRLPPDGRVEVSGLRVES